MSFPYEKKALSPYISENTIHFHYEKHHQAYVDNLNKLILGTEFESQSLEAIICATHDFSEKSGIFNNAAQIWNHNFYWNSMSPNGGGNPTGKIAEWIDRDFAGYENFRLEFKNAALTQFGSGWAWLIWENEKLKIVKTGNAHTPIAHGKKPLITIDVWEHAYYLEVQNRRADYIDLFLDHLISWDFANRNLA